MTLRENKINSIKKEMLHDSIHNPNTFVDLIHLNMIEYIKNIPYGHFEDEKIEGISIQELDATPENFVDLTQRLLDEHDNGNQEAKTNQ